ncbi:MAG: tyrosine-type recombinase/integrase [Chloroflexi bacterium]|nr:tyrosine-type recombinase/integrase [Chloroflexota bacterium]
MSALNRFKEFLPTIALDPETLTTEQLPAEILERFYTWLLKSYGRAHRTTAVAYASEVRAFFRFLDRRRWLHPDLSYEHMKDALHELVGRMHYKTPRVDDAVALVVTYVAGLPVPMMDGKNNQAVLELLRDKAILITLYATAMRREELSSLNRADIQDGRSSEGLVTGKGEKERTVFFDHASLAAIRGYLEARADSHGPLFLRHDDGRGKPGQRGEHWRLSPQSVWAAVKKYGKLAGVGVTTHHLRHLKARVMLNQGAQLSEVQDILGHASPETTKRIYAPYTTQHLREAFDRFSVPAEVVAQRVRRAAEDSHAASGSSEES